MRALSLGAFARRLAGMGRGAQSEDTMLKEVAARLAENAPAYQEALMETADVLAGLLHAVVWMLDLRRVVVDCGYALPFESAFLARTHARLLELLVGNVRTAPELSLFHGEIRGVDYGAVQVLSKRWFQRII